MPYIYTGRCISPYALFIKNILTVNATTLWVDFFATCDILRTIMGQWYFPSFFLNYCSFFSLLELLDIIYHCYVEVLADFPSLILKLLFHCYSLIFSPRSFPTEWAQPRDKMFLLPVSVLSPLCQRRWVDPQNVYFYLCNRAGLFLQLSLENRKCTNSSLMPNDCGSHCAEGWFAKSERVQFLPQRSQK